MIENPNSFDTEQNNDFPAPGNPITHIINF